MYRLYQCYSIYWRSFTRLIKIWWESMRFAVDWFRINSVCIVFTNNTEQYWVCFPVIHTKTITCLWLRNAMIRVRLVVILIPEYWLSGLSVLYVDSVWLMTVRITVIVWTSLQRWLAFVDALEQAVFLMAKTILFQCVITSDVSKCDLPITPVFIDLLQWEGIGVTLVHNASLKCHALTSSTSILPFLFQHSGL